MEASRAMDLSRRVMARSAEKLGGSVALARYLGQPLEKVERWIAGDELPPSDASTQAILLIVDEPLRFWLDSRLS